MSFKLETINLFCMDFTVYRSFFSTVFEVDFDHEHQFSFAGANFQMLSLHGFKPAIASSFVLNIKVSPEDLSSRIELFNFKHSIFPASLSKGNPATLSDPFGLNWEIHFS